LDLPLSLMSTPEHTILPLQSLKSMLIVEM
jgi:hypothetical protein